MNSLHTSLEQFKNNLCQESTKYTYRVKSSPGCELKMFLHLWRTVKMKNIQQTMCLTKPGIVITWPFIEKVAESWPRSSPTFDSFLIQRSPFPSPGHLSDLIQSLPSFRMSSLLSLLHSELKNVFYNARYSSFSPDCLSQSGSFSWALDIFQSHPFWMWVHVSHWRLSDTTSR